MTRNNSGTAFPVAATLALLAAMGGTGCSSDEHTHEGTVDSTGYGSAEPLTRQARRNGNPVLVTYVPHEWQAEDGEYRGYCPMLVFSQDDVCFDPEIRDLPKIPKGFDSVCRFANDLGNGGSSEAERNRKVTWELQWPLDDQSGKEAEFALCDDSDPANCAGLNVCRNQNVGQKPGFRHQCIIDPQKVSSEVLVIKYRVESEAYGLSDGQPLGIPCPPLDPHFVIRN